METPVAVDVPSGPRLEGLLVLPADPRAGLIVCHPHPLYGGDMDNPVVVRAAEVASGLGLATLRFNFRGVGSSGGVHDSGRGEVDDASAALTMLASRLAPGAPLGLCGYSFGAWVIARLAIERQEVRAVCLVAPPLGMFDFAILDTAERDLLLVAGSRDSYCPVADLERLANRLPGAETAIVEGADHFFLGKLFPLGAAIERWVKRWTGERTGRSPELDRPAKDASGGASPEWRSRRRE